MGCDIHLWVERQRGGRWEFAHSYELIREEDEQWIEWDTPYHERNYFLFGVLADVRNPSELMRPISPPRGMPPDVSDVGRMIVEEWDVDGHSHSWFSTLELLRHDWDEEVELSGYVSPATHAAFLERGVAPQSWSPVAHPGNVKMTWRQSVRSLCGDFVDRFLPELAEQAPPDETRVCFFFDN